MFPYTYEKDKFAVFQRLNHHFQILQSFYDNRLLFHGTSLFRSPQIYWHHSDVINRQFRKVCLQVLLQTVTCFFAVASSFSKMALCKHCMSDIGMDCPNCPKYISKQSMSHVVGDICTSSDVCHTRVHK